MTPVLRNKEGNRSLLSGVDVIQREVDGVVWVDGAHAGRQQEGGEGDAGSHSRELVGRRGRNALQDVQSAIRMQTHDLILMLGGCCRCYGN